MAAGTSSEQLRRTEPKFKGRRRQGKSKAAQPHLPCGNVSAIPEMQESAIIATDSAVSLLIVGLPRWVRPGKLRRPLRDSLRQFGLKKLRVASTHTGYCRGYAVVDLEKPAVALQTTTDGIEIRVKRKDGAEDQELEFLHTDADDGDCVILAHLSPCCGGKIDSLFPYVPFPLRKRLQLDSEALYSTTDQALGIHLVAALRSLCIVGGADLTTLGALDGCGCCGGSALMLSSAFGGPITAIEYDSARARLLASNLEIICPDGRAQCVEGDFCKVWPSVVSGVGVVFLDLPWGGPRYGESQVIETLQLGGVDLSHLILQLVEAEAAPLLALRLPRNMNVEHLVQGLSNAWSSWNFRWDLVLEQPERPMPFRFELGSCGIVLIFCLCSRTPRVSTCANLPSSQELSDMQASNFLRNGFCLAQLDGLVSTLQQWDGENGHRHRVAFFDWEAHRWIPITRWKGCKQGLRENDIDTGNECKHEPPHESLREAHSTSEEWSEELLYYRMHLRTFEC